MNVSPIALFVYNRPDHTKQTIEALALCDLAKDSELYIFSDAPKNPATDYDVKQVRDYVKTISGFKTINVIERDRNWGLADSIIDGVTHLCDQYGQVIVLEDDLIVSPHFLVYMNESLTSYQNEEQVMQISGYMFPTKLALEADALFMPLTTSWGWATWKRAWVNFDKEAKSYHFLLEDKNLRKSFDLENKYPYFKMLEAYKNDKVQSWAIRWYLSVFMCKGIVLYPKETLVENIGFDGSGVNCIASQFPENKVNKSFTVNQFPKSTKISNDFSKVIDLIPKTRISLKSCIQRLMKVLN